MLNEIMKCDVPAEVENDVCATTLYKVNNRPSIAPPSVHEDLRSFRQQVEEHGINMNRFTRHNAWRALFQLSMDWLVIIAAWRMVIWKPHFLTVFAALVLIGSRQRALGNLLHDSSHYLLCANKRINDAIAQMFLALPMLATIREYRQAHFQHHARLGDQKSDPDYFALRTFRQGKNTASLAFTRMTFDWKYWLENGFGGLLSKMMHVRMQVFSWWAGIWVFLSWISSPIEASSFVALWFGCRLTVFHLITAFREICDHTGLIPGGVFSYTRNVIGTPLLNQIFHPHDNGYHLVHHLVPTIPSHNLAAAHRSFSTLPSYASRAVHCDGYFAGRRPVVVCWVEKIQNHE